MWQDNLENGAIQTIDEAVQAEMRALAADTDADEDALRVQLRAVAYQAVAAQLGDSPLASAALSEVDWDTVIDEVCRIDTIEIPSPCCAATIVVKSKGGLVAREHGDSSCVETFEHSCSKCRRRYQVTVNTAVKGSEQTNREIVFEMIPDETVTYVYNEFRSRHGHSRSAHHFWRPLSDGTPVLAKRR